MTQDKGRREEKFTAIVALAVTPFTEKPMAAVAADEELVSVARMSHYYYQ
ncbi:MAG: hypothetical protein WDO19_14145 [Bacteroidota bacterium]